MKKFFNILLFILIVFCFSISINAEIKKNPHYEIYKNADEELKEQIGVVPPKYFNTFDVEDKKSTSELIVGAVTYPDKYDLRSVDNGNYLPHVGNQGDLGLCWAFAMNSTAESYALKHDLGNYNFSENQLDIATFLMSELSMVSLSRELGKGYNYYNGTIAWLYGYGPTTEENFGFSYMDDYTEAEIELKTVIDSDYPSLEINSTSVYAFVPSYYVNDPFYYKNELHTYLINPVKEYIVKNGAIATSTFMPPDFGEDEVEFVYTRVDMTNQTEIEKLYDDGYEGHALTIVGWDDHYGDIDNLDNDNDHTTGGEGAWLVQNSWGDVHTYFYISYYDSYVSFYLNGINDAEIKKYDYQYNFPLEVDNNETNDYVSYKFYIGENKEKLEKVKTYTINADYKEVTISVVSDEGTCFSSDIHEEYIGMYTYTFSDCYVSGNVDIYAYGAYTNTLIGEQYRLVLNTSSLETYLKPELFVDIDEQSSNGIVDNLIINNSDSYISLNLNTKNISSFTNYETKIYDSQGNDISSKFTGNQSDIINNFGIIYIKFLESIDSDKITISISGLLDEVFELSFNLSEVEGKGTQNNPYLISHPEDLILLSESTSYFKLDSDIDMKEITSNKNGLYYNESKGWSPINFYGNLDGDSHTIFNLNGGSLFNNLNYATIENLKIEAANIYKENYSSILSLNIVNSDINNVEISNSEVNSNYSSSIAHTIINSNISDIKINNIILNSENDTGILFNKLDMMANESININNIVIDDVSLINENINYGFAVNSIDVDADESFNKQNNSIIFNGINYISDDLIALYNNINIEGNISIGDVQNIIVNTNNQVLSLNDSINKTNYSTLDFNNIWDMQSGEIPRLIKFDIPAEYETIEVLFDDSYKTNDGYLFIIPREETDSFNEKVEKDDEIIQTIYKSDGSILEEGILKTGDTIVYSNKYKIKKYIIIILGDVNSDGKISVQDYKKVANYILAADKEKNEILELSAQVISADVTKDDKISVQDYRKISNYILDGAF